MPPFHDTDEADLTGVLDPDFLAIGLGGTNMMAMLWSVAMGRRAVGVEMRGDPFLGVHWNIRVDFYHQLGLIDRMMLERYGEAGVPRRANGQLFRLAECFYSTKTVAGDIVADEVIDGYDREQHIVGTIHHVEFIDDRWRDGAPSRTVTLLQPPKPPDRPEPEKIRTDMIEVLDGPSTFQAGAAAILVLLRRYLERIEAMDLESGREPRVRLFTRHRVVPGDGDGFIHLPDGRKRIRIEALQELDFRGKFVRVRQPGSTVIDIGVPELFVIAQGFHSGDAERLGFEQEDVAVDHHDGRGPVVAQADFLAGLIEVLVDGRLRRRIASEFDKDGKEYWVRQIAVGHENDPEVGWVLVQVPDFKTFDPVEAGLVAAGTDPQSPEFFAAYQQLVYDYYLEQAANILELPKHELRKVQMVYGPKLFSLIERMGKDAQLAANGVVAGDSFGNGHFLTSGGAMTGMVGHGSRVLRYWQARDAGVSPSQAIRTLAEGIKEDTLGWLHVSAQEYSEAVPINFGAERIRQIEASSGIASSARAHAIDATRRQRHALLPLDPSDWRRVFLRNGQVLSAPLPALHAMHPAVRTQTPTMKRGAKVSVIYVAPCFGPENIRFIEAVLGQPGVRMGLISEDWPGRLPQHVRDRLTSFVRVDDALDAERIAAAVEEMSSALGRPAMLLGTADDLLLPLAEVRDALGIRGMGAEVARNFTDKARMRKLLRAAGLPVVRHARDAEALADAQPCTLEVMSVGGVPAWFSGTRRDLTLREAVEEPDAQWSILLPREVDSPADAGVRRLGFAALRALGMDSGISTMKWFRRPDGSAVISDIAARPPAAQIVSLMGHAHGADMHRAYANALVNGLFAPVPRQYAAGAAFLRGQGEGTRVAAVRGLARLRRELGDMVVEARVPRAGQPTSSSAEGEGFVLLRHPETAVVERALRRLVSAVRVEMGPAPRRARRTARYSETW